MEYVFELVLKFSTCKKQHSVLSRRQTTCDFLFPTAYLRTSFENAPRTMKSPPHRNRATHAPTFRWLTGFVLTDAVSWLPTR